MSVSAQTMEGAWIRVSTSRLANVISRAYVVRVLCPANKIKPEAVDRPRKEFSPMATKLADRDSIKGLSGGPRLRLVPKIQPKVLIVEDHDDSRDMLAIILGLKNCCVTEASNGLEAVELALRIQPDVILMDGSLPLIDGLEATRRIRANEGQREVYIIAMNGWGTQRYCDDALAAGCDECLAKPIDLDQVDSLLAPFFTESSQPVRVAFAQA